MKSLAVRVLGDFGVDGVEPQAIGSRKARLALELLALAEGQVVPSDVLIDAVWADAPAGHRAHSPGWARPGGGHRAGGAGPRR
jgi:DNA-binding SARP family transcriptional activator